MPKFAVIIEGDGISIPADPVPVVGFFTTRYVKSRDARAAGEQAMAMVADEWFAGELAESNRGVTPALRVDEVRRLSWWSALIQRRAGSGYTFFQED
jgi:hypothetical protein